MDFQTEGNSIVYKSADGIVLARADFSETAPGVYDIFHTEVDASLQGQGVAGKLICGSLAEATCGERCIAIIGRMLWQNDCREGNQ